MDESHAKQRHDASATSKKRPSRSRRGGLGRSFRRVVARNEWCVTYAVVVATLQLLLRMTGANVTTPILPIMSRATGGSAGRPRRAGARERRRRPGVGARRAALRPRGHVRRRWRAHRVLPGSDPGGNGDARRGRGRRRWRHVGGGGDVFCGVRGVVRVPVVVGRGVLGRAGPRGPVGWGRGGRGARARAGIRADALLPADAAPAQARRARLLRRLDLVVTREFVTRTPRRDRAADAIRCMYVQTGGIRIAGATVIAVRACMRLCCFSDLLAVDKDCGWIAVARHSNFFPRTEGEKRRTCFSMCASLSIHANPY